MEKAEINVVRFSDENVIATSGGEKLFGKMSNNAFPLHIKDIYFSDDYKSIDTYIIDGAEIDTCGYDITLVDSDGKVLGDSADLENQLLPVLSSLQYNNGWYYEEYETNVWYHYYYEDNKCYFQACDDPTQHSN